jgi:hypothetical protein
VAAWSLATGGPSRAPTGPFPVFGLRRGQLGAAVADNAVFTTGESAAEEAEGERRRDLLAGGRPLWTAHHPLRRRPLRSPGRRRGRGGRYPGPGRGGPNESPPGRHRPWAASSAPTTPTTPIDDIEGEGGAAWSGGAFVSSRVAVAGCRGRPASPGFVLTRPAANVRHGGGGGRTVPEESSPTDEHQPWSARVWSAGPP